MYEQCPKKYEIIRAKKLVTDPPGKAADEGTRVHTLIEEYLRDDKWVVELLPYKRLLDSVKVRAGLCEEGFHFKRVKKYPELPLGTSQESEYELSRCEADDPDCWVRSYLDWHKVEGDTAEVIDWKTGKVKPSKQLGFYAWLLFTTYPELQRVRCTFHWINKNDQLTEWFERKDMEKLFAPFRDLLDRLEASFKSDIWPELPGNHCRYCPVTVNHCSNGCEV
jgi:hypothetical protein